MHINTTFTHAGSVWRWTLPARLRSLSLPHIPFALVHFCFLIQLESQLVYATSEPWWALIAAAGPAASASEPFFLFFQHPNTVSSWDSSLELGSAKFCHWASSVHRNLLLDTSPPESKCQNLCVFALPHQTGAKTCCQHTVTTSLQSIPLEGIMAGQFQLHTTLVVQRAKLLW